MFGWINRERRIEKIDEQITDIESRLNQINIKFEAVENESNLELVKCPICNGRGQQQKVHYRLSGMGIDRQCKEYEIQNCVFCKGTGGIWIAPENSKADK